MKHASLWIAVVSLLFVSPAAMAASWFTLESEHFLITFKEGTEPIAREVAYYAEQAQEKISQQLQHLPAGKTRIVLVDLGDIPNGWSTVQTGYNMEQYFLTYGGPSGPILPLRIGIPQTFNQLLAVHEHVHTIQRDRAEGVSRLLRSLFGKIGRFTLTPVPAVFQPDLTTPSSTIPISLVEGLAVYLETKDTEGGRLNSPLWEMFMRTDVVHDRMMGFAQASGNYRYGRPIGDAPTYLYGAYFLEYIEQTYGQDSVFDLMVEISKRNGLSYGRAFRNVLGHPVRAVWADFIAWAKARYTEQAEAIEAAGPRQGVPLTRHGGHTTSPVFSPDGATLGYVQSGNGLVGAVRLMQSDGDRNRTAVTIGSTASGEGFAWSPDGGKLAYGKLDWRDDRLVSDLYVYDLNTRKETRLTRGLRANAPTWSPDGRTLVFTAKTSPLESALMVMDANGGNVRTLVEGGDEMQFNSPRFSPDGGRIAVTVLQFGGFDDIYLVDPGNGRMQALTSDRHHDYAPQWSPDGRHVLFSSDRSGVFNLYAYRLSDGRLFQMTNALFGAFSPTMSPDGQQIAYVGYDFEGYDVYLLEADPDDWNAIPLERESLPQIPDFGALTADYGVKPYNPLFTLLPHAWQPLVHPFVSQYGASISAKDLLGHISYGLAAGYDLDRGQFVGQVHYEQTFSNLANEGTVASILGGPIVPKLALSVSPALSQLSGSLALQQTMQLKQTLKLDASLGTLGFNPDLGEPIQGLKLDGAWTLVRTGGKDRFKTQNTLKVMASQAFSDAGDRFSVGGSFNSALVFDDDLTLSVSLALLSLDPFSAGGALGVDKTLFYIGKLLFGTWPVYFERVGISASVSASASPQGSGLSRLRFGLTLPTVLWYRFNLNLSLSVACPLANGFDISQCGFNP